MSERLIQVSTLTEIADAIRDKKGTVNPIPVSSYASEIATIETGGGQSDKPFNLVSYFNGTLTEVDDVNGVIEEVGVIWHSSQSYIPSYMSSLKSPIAFVNMPELSYINLAGCKRLKIGAIVSCSALETINLPECETVGANATSWLSGVKVINLPKCSKIGMSAFNHPSSYGSDITINIPDFCDIEYNDVCSGPSYYTSKYASFNGVSFGVCISLYNGANHLNSNCFAIATTKNSQSKMTYISGSGVKWVCYRATSYASKLSGINLPNCEKIFSYAFNGCSSLSNLTLPKCWYVGRGAFGYCSSLTDISSVPLTHIESYAFSNCTKLSVVNWSIIEYLGEGAFAVNRGITEFPSTLNSAITSTDAFMSCYSLVSVSSPYLKKVAFPYCSALNYVNLPNCEELLSSGFRNCTALTSIYLPALKRISVHGAFASNSALVSVSLPELEEITGGEAFSRCYGLTDINLPKCSIIGNAAFAWCSSVVSVSLPNAVSISGYAFANMQGIESIDLPNCEYMDGNIFVSCYMLSSVSLPKLRVISGNNLYGVFGYCSVLSIVDLPALEYIDVGLATSSNIIHTVKLSNISHISGTAFYGMTSLVSLYIYASSVPILESTFSAFYSTPIYASKNGVWGSIYVYSSLYEAFKTATNWAVLSSRFVSM